MKDSLLLEAAKQLMAGTFEFGGQDTSVATDDNLKCFHYIEHQVIPSLIAAQDRQLLKEPKVQYISVSKNSKIREKVARLHKELVSENLICLFAYGPHIQKMLSIIELSKSKWTGKSPIEQRNKLSSFKMVVHGPNELIDKNRNVPILVSYISNEPEVFKIGTFANESLGFTAQ